jgi:hypothetical protein
MAFVNPKAGEVQEDGSNDPTCVDEHDIHDAGYDACQANLDLDANPWPFDSYAWQVWNDGWDEYDANER